MPDGVTLATDVYLPEDPIAVVIVRTPYDRANLRQEGIGWAHAGIAMVAQDVRGRYGSAGTWTPYRSERSDGAALADWIAAQPWAPATRVVQGASYAAFTAWSTAIERPDLVAGVISQVPAMGTHSIVFDPGGILRLAEHTHWWIDHAESRTSRIGFAAAMLTANPGLYRHLPVAGIGVTVWPAGSRWWEVIEAGPSPRFPDDDGPQSITAAELAALELPSLHIGGWYDSFLPTTLRQWELAGATAAEPPAKQLLVGPWAHELSSPRHRTVGARTHGVNSQLPLGPLMAEWVRSVAQGNPASGEHVYLTGANEWLRQWPLKTERVTYYSGASGTLDRRWHSGRTELTYRYDPDDPFPSDTAGQARPDLRTRTDCLRFTTAPAGTALCIAGSPVVRAGTAAPVPTDRVFLLTETTTAGAEFVLAIGTARLPAGQHDVTVTMSAVAAEIPAGSTLTLIVTGGWFPELARHPQHATDRYLTTDLRPAIHTVIAGATRVGLPIRKGRAKP
ncbi:CocE/NonD family hydrolase [Nocardia inohanensis]|uniref:CocE/NonD family hydrolase n=1 Tax=Nocardia inohanensis TaxID=209246 RepID=UPI00082A5FC9|nr:CocE/NonD family hydrolase [Nocardia inohanensis]